MENKELWKLIVKKVSKLMRLKRKEITSLKSSKIARLIGLAPFLCKSHEFLRYGVSNVMLFLAGSRDEVFDAHPADFQTYSGIGNRFNPLFNFPGGDVAMKKSVELLLVITTLSDMENDLELDKGKGKYNPYRIKKHIMDDYKLKAIEDLKVYSYSEIENEYSLNDAARGFWRG